MSLIKTVSYRNYKLEVHSDDCATSPREWDNLGTLVSVNPSRGLGDVQFQTADEVLNHIVQQVYPEIDTEELDELSSDEREALVREKAYLYPWFIADHSTISFSFYRTCSWDSGQIGLIYVTFDQAEADFGPNHTNEQVMDYLRSELNEYEMYVNGEVYGYRLRKCPEVIDFSQLDEIPYEEEDSTWGYIGLDYFKEVIQTQLEYGPQFLELLPDYF